MERFTKVSMHIRMCLIISITALSRNYLVYKNTWGPCGLRTSYSVSRNLLPMLNRWNYSEIHCFSVNLYRHVPWTIFGTRSMKYLPHFSTLAQGLLHTKHKTCFSQKPLGQSKPNFICKLSGTRKRKFIDMMLVT